MLIPRSYQRQTVKKIFSWQGSQGSNPGNPLICWPTGTGKAFGISMYITQMMGLHPFARLIITCPTEELVEQNYAELKEFWPSAPAGIYCSSLNRFDTQYPITFATIDSLDGAVDKFGKIDVMIPDECHRIGPKEASRYQRVYSHFKRKNKYFFMVGWTATDYRMGQGKLTDPGGLFTEVIYDATTLEAFNWFFDEGFLVPPIAAPTSTHVSTEKLSMLGGDFKDKDLQAEFERDKLSGKIYMALKESVEVARAEDRHSWIAFVPGKQACEDLTEMLDSLGVRATYIHSGLPRKERRERLKQYKKGLYECMVNNGILTTGFNHKPLDFMIMLRKTASASLWVQMLGRGTRPNYAEGFDISTKEGRIQAIIASGKRNFRVMDFVGNTERLGPINDPVKPKQPGEKKGKDAPIKICPMEDDDEGTKKDVNGNLGCGAYNHPSAKICFFCPYEFPIASSVEEKASTAALVAPNKKAEGPVVESFYIDKVLYKANFRTTKPTLVVTYHCGKKKYDKYVCLEHEGPAKNYAKRWWREMASGGAEAPVPESIVKALQMIDEGALNVPRKLLVWTNKKPVEIKGYEY